LVGGLVQLVGLATVIVVVAIQPVDEVAVTTTLVPTAIPEIVLPLMVPAEAVTVPLELNWTLYEAPLHTAFDTISNGLLLFKLTVTLVLALSQPLII
jgi:hypothetical protein